MNNIRYYIPGIFLILSGILIVAFPEILIALIASIIIIAGIVSLYIGNKIRGSETEYRRMMGNDWSSDDNQFDLRNRRPLFRYWGKWF